MFYVQRRVSVHLYHILCQCYVCRVHIFLRSVSQRFECCFGEVVYFSAHCIFDSFLSCTELNQDKNFIFNDDNNPDCNPFAKPNGTADRAAILETERIACSFFIRFFELPGPSLGAVTSWHFLKGCSVNTPSMFRGNGRGEDMGYKVRVVAPDANLL